MKFPRVDCASRPRTMPRNPALISSPVIFIVIVLTYVFVDYATATIDELTRAKGKKYNKGQDAQDDE